MATIEWSNSQGKFRITYSVSVASDNKLTVNISELAVRIEDGYWTGIYYPHGKIQVNGETVLTMDCNVTASHLVDCTSTKTYYPVLNYGGTRGEPTTASKTGLATGIPITISCVGYDSYSSGNVVYMYHDTKAARFKISGASTNIGTPTVYTVSYDANSGTGAPSAQNKASGQKITLSSTKPTKADTTSNGYKVTFDGNGGTPSKTSATAINTTKYKF
jgi:hypothetical protein